MSEPGQRDRVEAVAIATLVLAALAARLAVVGISEVQPHRDGWIYVELAEGLASGAGLVREGAPSIERPPGYPVFLALVLAAGGGMTSVAVLQAGLGALSALLVLQLGLAMGFRGRAALVGAWGFALFPDLVVYPSFILTETLWIFLALWGTVLGAQAAAGRRWRALPAGVCLGVACLVRSTTVIMVAAWVAFELLAWWRGRRDAIAPVAGLAVVAALVVLPWTIHASTLAGRLVVVDLTFDVSLRLGHHPGHLGDKAPVSVPPGQRDPVDLPLHDRARVHRSWGVSEILQHPLDTAARTVMKLARVLHPRGDLELLDSIALPRPGWWWLASTLATEVMLLALLVGAARERRWRALSPALAVVVVVLVTTLLLHHAGRYRLPALVFLMPVAAHALDRSSPLSRRRMELLVTAHLAALALATWLDLPRYVENFHRLW